MWTASNANVTSQIEFTATLSNESGTKEIATGSNSNFQPSYWERYKVSITWKATDNPPGFEEGDYFEFRVPKIFAAADPIEI